MDTKQALMLAALRLIAERGYENVSIDDIAAAVANTKGAVYHYFRSKPELYREALRYFAEHLSQLGSVELDATLRLPQAIGRTLTDLVTADVTDATGLAMQDVYYLFFDGMRRFPAIKAELQDLSRSYLRTVADRIKAQPTQTGERAGEIDALQFLVWLEGINLIKATTGGLIDKNDIQAMVERFFA